MTGGLVQDYSKSPIKTTQVIPETLGAGEAAPSGYTPQQQPPETNNPHHAYQTSPVRQSVDLSAPPPKRSLDITRPPGSKPPQPMGQRHDPAIITTSSPTGQNIYAPASTADSAAPSYGQPPSNAYSAQTPYIQNDLGGYRQSTIHDGGPSDYGNGEETSLEYAEKAWKSATNAVSEYTSTAGEVAGKTLGNIKGWLNPESKGLR